MYTQVPSTSETDYSNFIISQENNNICQGWGTIKAMRAYSNFNLTNTFFLGINNSFISITTTVSSANLTNAMIWVGTKDDFVGVNDQNLKKKGNLINGGFIQNTANNQSSNALMITNGIEGVLFYSMDVELMAYDMCCSFFNVINRDPFSQLPATPIATDGSYAAILKFGNLMQSSKSITWYYAAGSTQSISIIINNVATTALSENVLVVSYTPISTLSITVSSSPTPTLVPSLSSSSSITLSNIQTTSNTPSNSLYKLTQLSTTSSVINNINNDVDIINITALVNNIIHFNTITNDIVLTASLLGVLSAIAVCLLTICVVYCYKTNMNNTNITDQVKKIVEPTSPKRRFAFMEPPPLDLRIRNPEIV